MIGNLKQTHWKTPHSAAQSCKFYSIITYNTTFIRTVLNELNELTPAFVRKMWNSWEVQMKSSSLNEIHCLYNNVKIQKLKTVAWCCVCCRVHNRNVFHIHASFLLFFSSFSGLLGWSWWRADGPTWLHSDLQDTVQICHRDH